MISKKGKRMDKRENGFWIASVSLVGATVLTMIVYLAIDFSLGVHNHLGNAAYDDFLSCIFFSYQRTPDTFLISGSLVFYLGLALFLADAIFVVIKRSPRYIFLGLAGILSFTLCAMFIQNLNYASESRLPAWYYGFTLSGVIAMGVLGLGSFSTTFVFGRKLLKKASD